MIFFRHVLDADVDPEHIPETKIRYDLGIEPGGASDIQRASTFLNNASRDQFLHHALEERNPVSVRLHSERIMSTPGAHWCSPIGEPAGILGGK